MIAFLFLQIAVYLSRGNGRLAIQCRTLPSVEVQRFEETQSLFACGKQGVKRGVAITVYYYAHTEINGIADEDLQQLFDELVEARDVDEKWRVTPKCFSSGSNKR